MSRLQRGDGQGHLYLQKCIIMRRKGCTEESRRAMTGRPGEKSQTGSSSQKTDRSTRYSPLLSIGAVLCGYSRPARWEGGTHRCIDRPFMDRDRGIYGEWSRMVRLAVVHNRSINDHNTPVTYALPRSVRSLAGKKWNAPGYLA